MDDHRYAADLRKALRAAGYTVDGVAELLGPTAQAALARNETAPARRRTGDGSPLATLIRLFLLQMPVSDSDAERALPQLVDPLCEAGLLKRSGSEVIALLDCRPYGTEAGDLWVVSDLTPGLDGAPSRVTPDYVLGISPASTSLAQLAIRRPVQRALDLGTGCGVQAIHLADHAQQVVATDINRRALWLASLNMALNDLPVDRVDIRYGSYFEPVAGENFDLIVTNPPFVISPGTGERLTYRDSGLPGDRVVEHIVRAAPHRLTDGGWCQIVANWAIKRGTPWDERLAEWLDERCDALVVQREVLDPTEYVELWLKDAGLHGAADYLDRYDAWLTWFAEQDIEAVGFGWINLRLRRTGVPRRDFLHWPHAIEQPIAATIAQWGDAVTTQVTLDSRLVCRADVLRETISEPGAEDPQVITLRQQRGLRRVRNADTVTAGLVGACDGQLTVGQILDALAELLGLDVEHTRATYLPVARELVIEGFLEPTGT